LKFSSFSDKINKHMKVVIDTNILIGSTWDEYSHSKQIIDEVISGNIEVFATNATIRENKLLLKKAVPSQQQKEFLEDYFARIQEVRPRQRLQVVKDDPEDDKFFEAALEAGAEYIITNDHHLLDIYRYKEIKVARPSDFWLEYQSGDDSTARQHMLDLMGK
jgi:uncharacterized protein